MAATLMADFKVLIVLVDLIWDIVFPSIFIISLIASTTQLLITVSHICQRQIARGEEVKGGEVSSDSAEYGMGSFPAQ